MRVESFSSVDSASVDSAASAVRFVPCARLDFSLPDNAAVGYARRSGGCCCHALRRMLSPDDDVCVLSIEAGAVFSDTSSDAKC